VFKLQSQGTGAVKLELAKQLRAEKEAEKLKELIEEVFTKVSQPLNVVATFSNGETIYANA
jgi:hypothetical protein